MRPLKQPANSYLVWKFVSFVIYAGNYEAPPLLSYPCIVLTTGQSWIFEM